MTLYEKFELTIPIESYLEEVERNALPETDEHSLSWQAHMLPYSVNRLALNYYYHANTKQTKVWAKKAVKANLEYFFGKWRSKVKTDAKTYDPSWWHHYAEWIKYLQQALCWASCLEDWSLIKRLCEYPTNDCKPGTDFDKEDKAAYLALVSYLRGEPLENSREYMKEVAARKKQKPKHLVALIEALHLKDAVKFQTELNAYLKYYKKSEFKRRDITKLVSFDGTIFVNLARRAGLKFEIPEFALDHIIDIDNPPSK